MTALTWVFIGWAFFVAVLIVDLLFDAWHTYKD